MLLNESVNNIAHKRGLSHDIKYKERLKRDVSVGRGEILRREITKRRTVPHMHAHTLDLLALEETTLTPAAGSTLKVWKTVEKVPKPLMYQDDNPGFIAVTGADGAIISFITPERLQFRDTSKFKPARYYFYANGYLYFFDNIEYISVRAVFADLLAVGEIRNKEKNLCVPELHIPDDLHHAIEKLLEEKQDVGYKPSVSIDEDQPKEGI